MKRGRKTPLKQAQSLTRRVVKANRAKVTPAERAGKKGVHKRSSALTGRRLCERCGRRPGREVHHRKNRSQGGRWALANLLDLCSPCHQFLTVNPALAKEPESGWSVASHQDPAAVPVRLAGRGLVLLTDTGEIQEIREAA
jgi:hypothetical protein